MSELDIAPRCDDSPVEQAEGAGGSPALVELAQEVALVTRALHLQLLPDSAPRALSGVSGMVTDVGEPRGPEVTMDVSAATVSDGSITVSALHVSMPFPEASPALPIAPSPEADAVAPAFDLSEHSVPPVVSIPVPLISSMDLLEVVDVSIPGVPVIDVPVIELPVSEVPAIASPPPAKADHRSMAMLAEIGFLDEESADS